MKFQVSNENKKSFDAIMWLKKIFICWLSITLLGIAAVLAVRANLGNDPISVFYQGLGFFTGINMGYAANIINCSLAILVFFLDRKYIHIGTIIYAVFLGLSIAWGFHVYDSLNLPTDLSFRIFIAVLGYLLAFIAISAYISIDIGIDPWTAIAIIISKRLNKQFGRTRIFIDTSAFLMGAVLGGKYGIMTFISAIVGGPIIQKFTKILDKVFSKMLKYSD